MYTSHHLRARETCSAITKFATVWAPHIKLYVCVCSYMYTECEHCQTGFCRLVSHITLVRNRRLYIVYVCVLEAGRRLSPAWVYVTSIFFVERRVRPFLMSVEFSLSNFSGLFANILPMCTIFTLYLVFVRMHILSCTLLTSERRSIRIARARF